MLVQSKANIILAKTNYSVGFHKLENTAKKFWKHMFQNELQKAKSES